MCGFLYRALLAYFRKQVQGFTKFFTLSFAWSFFQWFYSGGESCGFINFPTLGLKAWKQTSGSIQAPSFFFLDVDKFAAELTPCIESCRFMFDFSMTYVGAGMICSHLVNLSLLVGAVLSWGVMWPLISNKKGDWFPDNIKESSMKSLNGYKVCFIGFQTFLLHTMLSFYLNKTNHKICSFGSTGVHIDCPHSW